MLTRLIRVSASSGWSSRGGISRHLLAARLVDEIIVQANPAPDGDAGANDIDPYPKGVLALVVAAPLAHVVVQML